MQSNASQTGKRVPSSRKSAVIGFSARMAEVVEAVGGLGAAAKITGASDDTVARWRDEKGKAPFAAIVALCDAARFSINWLATGSGPRDSSEETLHVAIRTQQEQLSETMLQIVNPEALAENAMVMIPRFDIEASAGSGAVAQSEQPIGFVAFQEAYLRDLGINPRFAQVIRVSGRSMYPTLDDKEFVVLDTSIDRVMDEAIYAVVYGGLVLIKRVRVGLDGTVTLSSDNREGGFTDQVVKPSEVDDLHIVGRLKGHFRVM